jgi:hypothetical protein
MKATVAAVINTSPDVVDLLRRAFDAAGIVTVSGFTHQIRDGQIDLEAFLRQHDPDVIVYDIAPPYDANWNFFQHVSGMPAAAGRQFVLTTTNVAHVEKLAGRDQRIYEIVGKAADIDPIVRAVKEATRARPIR